MNSFFSPRCSCCSSPRTSLRYLERRERPCHGWDSDKKRGKMLQKWVTPLHDRWISISYLIQVIKGDPRGKGKHRNMTDAKKSFQTFFLRLSALCQRIKFLSPSPEGRSGFGKKKMKLCWFLGRTGQERS